MRRRLSPCPLKPIEHARPRLQVRHNRRNAPAQCRHCRIAQATSQHCNSGHGRLTQHERTSLVQSQSEFVTSLRLMLGANFGMVALPSNQACTRFWTASSGQQESAPAVAARPQITRRYSLAGVGKNRDRSHSDDLVGAGDSSPAPGVNLLAPGVLLADRLEPPCSNDPFSNCKSVFLYACRSFGIPGSVFGICWPRLIATSSI
jgi:hypothetical protein